MMNRKERRAIEKKTGKGSSRELSQKMSQFQQLPEQCCACKEPFDKKDKEMIQSWAVVVRQEAVRLFCPDCINKTQEIINEHTQIKP